MAIRTDTETTLEAMTFGQRLRYFRENLKMSLGDAGKDLARELPRALAVTPETIRFYETDNVSEIKANPAVIAGLAVIYGVSVADISPYLASQVEELEHTLKRAKEGPRRPADIERLRLLKSHAQSEWSALEVQVKPKNRRGGFLPKDVLGVAS